MKLTISQQKIPENMYVVYSTLSYGIVAIALLMIRNLHFLASLMFVVGISSYLHHRFPWIMFLRVCDWICALLLIVILAMNFTLTTSNTLFVVLLFSIWLFSFYHFHYSRNMLLYSLSHTVWHILSAIAIYAIVV